MFGAVARYLANVAGPAGALVVLDDLQWAGADTLDLLATLVRAGQAAEPRLRVLGAYRDTEASAEDPLGVLLADLASAGLASQQPLAPLAPAEAAQLLDSLLGGMAEPGSPPQQVVQLRERVVERAGGVPYFLVSWAQAARAGALDEGPQGADSRDGVPWDLAQGLRQRVAALPDAAREVLGVAAVVGRVVPHDLLLAVAARPVAEVLAGLDAACRARLLEEGEGHTYRFTHDVIREVVEADLGGARRTVLHRQIARTLEQGWDPADEQKEPPAELIAYHYAWTPDDGRAAHWLERAGDQAAVACASAAAIGHYTAARARLAAAGRGVAALSALDEKLGDLWLLTGEYAQAQADFARARPAPLRGGRSCGARRAIPGIGGATMDAPWPPSPPRRRK
jgi:predicted ATPase